jgi:hypothetical protein
MGKQYIAIIYALLNINIYYTLRAMGNPNADGWLIIAFVCFGFAAYYAWTSDGRE